MQQLRERFIQFFSLVFWNNVEVYMHVTETMKSRNDEKLFMLSAVQRS